MATVIQEGRYATEFLISEGPHQVSRDKVTIVSGSGVVKPGTVLGKITASGKFKPSPDTGADGSQVAVAALLYGVDATTSDQAATVISRMAETNNNMMFYEATVNDATKRAAKVTQLAAVNIIVR